MIGFVSEQSAFNRCREFDFMSYELTESEKREITQAARDVKRQLYLSVIGAVAREKKVNLFEPPRAKPPLIISESGSRMVQAAINYFYEPPFLF